MKIQWRSKEQIEQERLAQEAEEQTRREKQQEIENAPNRIDILEYENAELWYNNMLLESKVDDTEFELSVLWYEIMMGGI